MRDDMPPHVEPMYTLLPPNARRLVAVGTAAAALARRYRRSYPAASFQAIDPAATDDAFEIVHAADAGRADDALFARFAMADGWVFDGTLETLPDPARVLAGIRRVMQADTAIVARIANTLYWRANAGQAGVAGSAGLVALFQEANLHLATGIGLQGEAPDAGTEQALRDAALAAGRDAGVALAEATPTHFLVRAVPAWRRVA